MKVFISWSGETSHAVALALRDWLPSVLQSIEPYVSSEDIEKGARWSVDVGHELDTTSFGILCVTASNVGSPWLNFEAGALAKSMESSRVSPILIGLRPADLVGPLAQFQATMPERNEIVRLLSSINSNNDNPIDESRLVDAVGMWWPQLEERLQVSVKMDDQASEPQRSVPDMIVELLEITRGLQKQVLRNDRGGQESLAPTNERSRQAASYENDVLRALSRVLPPGASLRESEPPSDCAITSDNRTILVDIKYGMGISRYLSHFQTLLDQANRLSLVAGETVMILLVTNSPIPDRLRDEIAMAPAVKWVAWGDHNDTDELKEAIEYLLSRDR